jgi:hypothetical protein
MAVRKYLLLLSQSAYLFLGFLLGKSALEAGFDRVLSMPFLSFIALGAAVALAVCSEGLVIVLRRGALFQTLSSLLRSAPFERLRGWMDRVENAAKHTDGTAAQFFGAPRRVHLALAVPCLAGWLLEATETWLALRVLGVSLGFGDALGIEAVVVLARHVFVVLPAGSEPRRWVMPPSSGASPRSTPVSRSLA